MSPTAVIQQTAAHLFRHESGKMTAVLSKLLGIEHLETAQDLVQDTLLQALNTWPYNGVPDNPTAWLYRVARNKTIDYLRRQNTFRQISSEYSYLLRSEYTLLPAVSHCFEQGEIEDSQLRMLFACCHPAIPAESQIALALKTLCGLSAAEIARAFLSNEETITKRIYRAKEKIRAEAIKLELPFSQELPARLDAVLHCLYLLFNEGYNSSHQTQLIREELCEEAMRLTYMLLQNKITALPRTYALLALMCFQTSRLQARLDDRGQIILLKYQNRSLWYRPLIEKGFAFLESATAMETTTYHLEAAIAYFHAIAPSFAQTDWKAIYYLYSLLYQQHPTPFIALNKGIAAAYAVNPATALLELQQIKGLDKYYLYHTALGDVYFDSGYKKQAQVFFEKALCLTTSIAEQQLIQAKIRSCTNE